MYYLRYVFIPLYLVVLNIYEQSDFLRSELKSIKIMSKIPEKKIYIFWHIWPNHLPT